MNNSPCYLCTERSIGADRDVDCHGSCERFLEYKRHVADANRKERLDKNVKEILLGGKLVSIKKQKMKIHEL